MTTVNKPGQGQAALDSAVGVTLDGPEGGFMPQHLTLSWYATEW